MDLAYWNFTQWPFQSRRQANLVPCGAAQEEALARLLFLIEEGRLFGMLAGAAGTGKSCLLGLATTTARRHGRLCIAMDATGMSASDFVRTIAVELLGECDIDANPGWCWSRIHQSLDGLALIDQPVLIVLDHFDSAAEPLGTSVRRLANLSLQAGAKVTVLLASRSIQKAGDLRDELDLSVELTGWSNEETSGFIAGQLKAAGARQAIFTDEAIETVQALAHGNPSQITRICDLALLAAMNDGRHDVDSDVIEAVVAELRPARSEAHGLANKRHGVDARALV